MINIQTKNDIQNITDKDRYLCETCPYIYDPEKGDPEGGIAPGTPFEDIPDVGYVRYAKWTRPIL
jgi:Rubredoxin